MTNYEHYREQIERISETGDRVAIDKDTNEIVSCTIMKSCKECLFFQLDDILDENVCCMTNAMRWAASEYVEPVEPEVNWYTVPIDTPVLVSNNNNKERRRWGRGHFAGVDRYGKPQTFARGRTSWSNGEYPYEIFDYIKLAEVEYRPLKGANNEDTDEYKKGE